MPDMDNPKNPLEELQEWAAAASEPRGRKLTFSEKCGIAYALQSRGVSGADIRKAFALSAATVSWLKHCLQDGRIHYRDVWKEYQDLGPERFAEKHYAPMHWRLKRVKLGLAHLDETKTDIVPKLPWIDPNADKYLGLVTLPDGERWTVAKRPLGYAIENAREPGVWHGAEIIDGRTPDDWRPFLKSQYAFDAIYDINGRSDENPRPRPGRPRQ